MGYGDAYKYAIGIKPENVEKLYELLVELDAMHSRLTEELENGKINPACQILWYDLIPIHEQMVSDIVRDNTWMTHVTSDDCHDRYDAVEKYTLVNVRKFYENIFPKDQYSRLWKSGEFLKHLDEYIYIAHSHYDTHEDWLLGFSVIEYNHKQVPSTEYHQVKLLDHIKYLCEDYNKNTNDCISISFASNNKSYKLDGEDFIIDEKIMRG